MAYHSLFKSFDERGFSFWKLQALGWLLYLAAYAFHLMLFRNPGPKDFMRILVVIAFGFATGFLLRLFYRRVDVASRSPWSFVWIILAGSAVSGSVWFWGSRFAYMTLAGGTGLFLKWIRAARPPSVLMPLFFDTALFLSWSALYFTIKFWMNWKEQKERLESANLTTQQTQFQMLRYQLNPHFLFNALNAIRALIVEDKPKAKKMVTELSEFLRYSLVSRDRPVVPFQVEMEAVQRYLAIEKIRYEDKLAVSMQVEPGALEYPVMSFIVHPLVENAVRFGMRTSAMPLRVKLSARISRSRLAVDVENTGKWVNRPKNGAETGTPRGSLACIRRRLESAYPGRHCLEVRENGGSVRAHLELDKNTGMTDDETVPGIDH
jgi:two-component system LytT family sensor kinase